ncbi:unnamed protein product [Plutella xylostella]|uniref:(diamondback moth) hypothetical protein n=1 Tax=Plutella xylostella TaxID=51655 RepID=A0A8S4G917_PLUXY|nr:unnamed protein product [Plutella xylostella]
MEAAGGGATPSQPVQVAKMAYCDAHTPSHVLQVNKNNVLVEFLVNRICGIQRLKISVVSLRSRGLPNCPRKKSSESEGDVKSADLSIIRQKGRDKIKQARRVLALKRTWSPVVLVPTLPAHRVAEIAPLAGDGPAPAKAQLMKRLLAYWTLKRHSRNGVPLLRRLQTSSTSHGTRGIQDGTVNVRELCNQLKYWQRIRQDLERARLLCELVRKRERLKAEHTRAWERCVTHALQPGASRLEEAIEAAAAEGRH